jgi:hypothetical protein
VKTSRICGPAPSHIINIFVYASRNGKPTQSTAVEVNPAAVKINSDQPNFAAAMVNFTVR